MEMYNRENRGQGTGNRKLIQILIFSLVLCIFTLTLTCLAQDKIVAIVNHDVITQKDLDDFTNFMHMQLSAEFQGRRLQEKIESLKPDLLNKLIEDHLILEEAKAAKIRVDESRVRSQVAELKARYPTERAFHDDLISQGLVQADLEKRIREQLLMYNVIEEKVRSKITVSPVEVTKFYEKNIQEFSLPQQRSFESLAVPDNTLLKEVLKDLSEGLGFNEVTAKYSLGLNKIDASRADELRPEISREIFRLKPEEVSSHLKLDDSFYIFRLTEIIPARQQSLTEVQEKIYTFLYDSKLQERLSRWLQELKKHSFIKTFP